MRKKESVPNRRYTDEFKIEAVRLALSTVAMPQRNGWGFRSRP